MAGPRYIADALSHWVEFDGLIAFYHAPSGATHVVAPPVPQILDAIAGDPADADEILARIGERFDVRGGREAMAARLMELEAAGLVSRP